MADLATCLPLTRESVLEAHKLIKPLVHYTPVVTSQTLSRMASTPRELPSARAGAETPSKLEEGTEQEDAPGRAACPVIRLWFKCENLQRIGAFKARGAFHAIERLKREPGWVEGGGKERGVVTHSSGRLLEARFEFFSWIWFGRRVGRVCRRRGMGRDRPDEKFLVW